MKILKNTTGSDIFISDVGQTVPANDQITIDPSDYDKYAESSDVIVFISTGDLVVNDGNEDLGINYGVWLILGSSPLVNYVDELKNNSRLKVEVDYAPGAVNEIYKVKITNNDISPAFLEDKITVVSGDLTETTLNGGGDEDLQLGLATTAVTPGSYGTASQVSSITVDSKGRLTSASNTSINITASQVSDFTEASQDAVGAALTDTASVDLGYNDGANQITATVLPAGVDHNSLANLTVADPHTQYVKDAGTVTDNAIVRYDGTDGRTIQNSSATITDTGDVVTPGFVRVGNTSDTTNGNIRLAATGELQAYQGGAWKVLDTVPVVTSATADTSTTSGTYAVIGSMTQTPIAGTYMCFFTCTAALGSDTTGDISFFINGVEETTSTRRLAIDATGILGATASFETPICIITQATVNGSQAIDIRFRENGGGTLTVGPRRLKLIPISR